MFEWMLVVTMMLSDGEHIPMVLKRYSNPIDCKSAVDVLEHMGGRAECLKQKSDKVLM